MNRLLCLVVTLLALSSFACGSSRDAYAKSSEKIRIEVTVTYLDQMMLPPGSTVRAAMYDETHELKPAVSSSAITTRHERGVPVELEISYPRDQFDDSHEYVVRAEIQGPHGKFLFVTDEPVQVITNQTEPQKMEFVLKRAD